MSAVKKVWLRIPRPVRGLLQLLGVLAAGFLFYCLIGAPTPSAEHSFRRTERRNMVGPGEIIDILDKSEYSEFECMYVAQTEEGIIFCSVDDTWGNIFSYREKTGDITVLAPPKTIFNWGISYFEVNLPIYVFDEYPNAVRAELDVDVVGTYRHNLNGEKLEIPLDEHWNLEAPRQEEGFFRFWIQLPLSMNSSFMGINHGAPGYALDRIAEVCSTDFYSYTSADTADTFQATVRLYDENDDLIIEKELTIRTAAGQTHAERGEPLPPSE